jgi:hypothetical protein
MDISDLFDLYDSLMIKLVLAKWASSLYTWEQLIDCLMLIMRMFTSRECQCTKEWYAYTCLF